MDAAVVISDEWSEDARIRLHPLDGALLGFDPRRGLNVRVDGPGTRGLRRRAPRTILFGITNRCTLACGFCSRDPRAESGWDEASAHAALAAFAAAGVLEVAFGGGEPLAFRGFDRLLERLRRDTPLALHVTTNGDLLTEARAERLAPLLGELRLSIYDDTNWPTTIDRAVRAGATVGANVLCTPARIDGLPALLRRLADRGVNDVALLRYVGDDPALHLDRSGEARLAAVIHASPLRVRVSTCFGDRLHGVPRLFGGPGGQAGGACGAGSEFLTITSDRRVRACSFHDDPIAFTTVDEALAIYRRSQDRLAEPAGRRGCARPGPRPPALADGIRVWRGFGGNNSGDALLVGRFDDRAGADAFMAALLPGYAPGRPLPPAWTALLEAAGIDPSRGHSPDTMASVGAAVMMHTDSTLADDFVPLRALLWRRGGRALLGGRLHYRGIEMIAGVRARGRGGRAPPRRGRLRPLGRHGDLSFGTASIGGPADTPHSLATRSAALRTVTEGGAQVAAELVEWPEEVGAGPRALARVRADASRPEWLSVRFPRIEDAAAFARDLAPDLRDPPAVASTQFLARFDRVSPRLGWLAARRGGVALVLQGDRLWIGVQVDAAEATVDGGERFLSTLRAFAPGAIGSVARRTVGAAPFFEIITESPLALLAAIDPAILAAGVGLRWLDVRSADALPAALSRIARELRRGGR
ncbi:MAG: radical SAM protein [Nannocystaceae bacterium]